jgi:hypothetical protein
MPHRNLSVTDGPSILPGTVGTDGIGCIRAEPDPAPSVVGTAAAGALYATAARQKFADGP